MVLPLFALLVLTLLYLAGVLRRGAGPTPGVSGWRVVSWCAGASLLALGLLPRFLPFPEDDIRQHMIQHLLLGMAAPLGLVMAAPVTVLLRNVPSRVGRSVTRFLQSRVLQLLVNPVTALVLNLGGMAALYFTPLHDMMMQSPALHYLVHFHFVAAGCLYVWVIAGPDPAPHRPSVPARLIVLGVAIVIHSVMAQMLYAGVFVTVQAPDWQLRQAAELMYYGGDITELLLAFAMVSTWRPERRSRSVGGFAGTGRKVGSADPPEAGCL